ncbi:histidine--tRNA ligase [Aquirufa sp.]|jgi:histidyl-tRNA synthetase|uniref:histidine--tRNA ligase n=1 Tax=Aquirufa sp. TaxID=2676249 RepID=UPI0037C15656
MKVIQKPNNARGTRDFGPKEMALRNYVFSIIKRHFEAFGFQSIETPAIENLSVLTGKYGDEGDQLLFKILNSGDYLSKVNVEDFELGSKVLMPKIAEKGLRYDLTVPFARFVAMNRNDIAFPFRRSQIQPVWRADRPQKGRYREFYQCDADIIGSDSLINEVELIALFQAIFSSLNLKTNMVINSRKILAGIVDTLGANDLFVSFAVAVDKLDKIGWDSVGSELLTNGFSQVQIDSLQKLFSFQGDNAAKIQMLDDFFGKNVIGQQGLTEIRSVLELSSLNGYDNSNVLFDFKLARGLSYYTGLIYEGKAVDLPFGSIVGGGRYDNLTESFGLPNMSGVGISFGIERIIDVMRELNLFPDIMLSASKLLITYFDENGQGLAVKIANELRKANIPTEVYPDIAKIKKSFEFADKKGIPFVGVIGEQEIQDNSIAVKDMKNGEQRVLSISELIQYLSDI